jgi:hypothetical protein
MTMDYELYIYRRKITSLHYVLLKKSVTIILLKQLTHSHSITIWDSGNIHNHMDVCAGLKEEDQVG